MRRTGPLPRLLRSGSAGLPLVLSGVLFVSSSPLLAQQNSECDVPSHMGWTGFTRPDGTRLLFFSFPVFRCPGGTMISADSATVTEATNYTHLIGNVEFWDEEMRLTADTAHYFAGQSMLQAYGDVVLTNEAEGSVIRGDAMDLLRAGDQRPEDQLTVTGRRPHATLYPALQPDTTAAVADTADTVPAEEAPDSLGPELEPPDTLGLELEPPDPDALVLPPDTTPPPPDTTVVLADPPVPQQSIGPGEGRTPYEIDADTIYLEGSQYFKARGSVEIIRDSLNASADSVEYDQLEGALNLYGSAGLVTSDYDLAGNSIILDIPQDDIRKVLALGDAVLEGEDLLLLAPIITLVLSEGKMEQLVAVRDPVADSLAEAQDPLEAEERVRPISPHAVPALRDLALSEFPVRAYALAQDFILQSDSMEVIAPGDVLEEVWAMGNARGESLGGDSLNAADTPPLFARDWLEGDTIRAIFGTGLETEVSVADSIPPEADSVPVEPDSVPDTPPLERDPMSLLPAFGDSVPPGDSTEGEYQLQKLVAMGNARSLYRFPASDTTAAAEELGPSFHYVIGQEITILMSQGEVEKMEVTGKTRGIHLEPVIRRTPEGGEGGDAVGTQPVRRSPGSGEGT